MGRLRQPLRFRINSGVAFRASAFCLATETLTVEAAAWPAGSAVADSVVLLPAIGAAGPFPAWSAISSEPVDTDDLIEMAVASQFGPPPWQLPVTSATTPVAQDGHSSVDVLMPNASMESQAASGPDSCSEPSPHAVLSRLLAEAADPPTTTSTTDVPRGPHLGCSTTTTSTSSSLPPPVTIACAVPGDQPRCVRLHPGEHISQALWSILQDPGRVLPSESTWALATCPRTFPDRIAGRLVLATFATTHPFRCNVWLDIRSEPPQLFAATLDWDCTAQEILQRFGLGREDLLLFLDGALAGDSPALRNGCVLTLCLRGSECLTEPLLWLFPHYPSLRLLQFAFRIPTCILELNRARHAASFYAVPIAFSAFRRDFFFRFAVEAQACSDAVGIAPHQALVALCCPAFGLCCTTAGFRVSPTAQQLRPFICGTWPELTDHKIADTGECFEDAAYYTITHPSCPLTAWLRAGGAHNDVLFLPVDVRPEIGIPCSPGLYPHVFRHEGAWGLYDLRAGPPVETPLGAFASRALTAFAAAAGGETPSSTSGYSVSSDVSTVEHTPGPVLSVTRDPDPVTVSEPDALSPHSPLFGSPDSAADPSSDDGLVLLQTRGRCKARAVREASTGTSSTGHRALADSPPEVPRCRSSISCQGRQDTHGFAPASTLRAIPTPCRAHRLARGARGVSAPDLSDADANAPLVVADAGHEDGLGQASRTCGVSSCPVSPAPATPVSLHCALQLEAPTFSDCSSGFARADWLFLRRDTETVPGMLPTCRALSARAPGDARSRCRLHVYTDGSFLPDPTLNRAGWAFAVFTESSDPGGRYFGFLGFAGGSLRPWLHTALNIDCDCYDAECIALALACAWCLAVPPRVQLVMHFDSISAGGAASGRAQPRRPQDGRTAAAIARYCAQALEAAGHNVHWQWVRGHSGSLGNEVCDAVSRACAADVFDASPISSFAWQAFLSPQLPWLWRHFAVSSTCPSMEALCSGVYEPADTCSPCFVPAACPRGATTAPCKVKLSASFCSFNVQTLRDVKGVLWEQFVKARLHVVGLQETRLRFSSFIEGSSFFEFHAAAANGDGGVSLLFSRTAPYGFMQGKPLRFAKHHLRCLHSDSHCICVCVRAPFLAVTVVAAHGPHSGHSNAAIRQWWAALEAMLPRGHDLVILADCNARLGSVVSEGVGDHAPAAECPAGTALREFVARRDLWIPSNFSRPVRAP